MAQLISGIDPSLVLIILLPLAAGIACWALRVYCTICGLDPPDFWRAVLAVVIICVANVVLRFWLRVIQVPVGSETQILAALLMTILLMAMSTRTGPFAACKVTFVHALLCGLIYGVVQVMSESLIAGVL